MKVGILGGTFNPIHNGHLIIAEQVRIKFGLSKVLFIPCNIPYHKKSVGLASATHRLVMVKLAIKDNPYFNTSDIEIKRGGLTYSIDTIRCLKEIYPIGTQFYFIIGTDSLPELILWREIKTLARLCRFIAVDRPGFVRPKVKLAFLSSRISYSSSLLIDISSSRIRQSIKYKQSVKYLVPISVQNYISKHRLYI